jgi:DMSO reductase anchor subunit
MVTKSEIAPTLNVYTTTAFIGFEPMMGTAAVIVAKSTAEAAMLLQHKLATIGLLTTIDCMDMIPISKAVHSVNILCDGSY